MQHFLRCNLFLLHFLPHSLSPFLINALSIMVHCTTNCGQVVSLDTSIRNTQLLTKVLKNNCRRSWRRLIPGCSVCFGDLLSPALPPPTTLPTCFFLALGRYNMLANGLFRTKTCLSFPSVLLVLSLTIVAFLTGSLKKLLRVVQPCHYGLWDLLRLQPQH